MDDPLSDRVRGTIGSRACQRCVAELRSVYRPTPAACASQAADEPSLLRLLAIEGEQIVGTVRYCESGNRLHLNGLAVSRRHRGRGIAKHLISALVEIARTESCSTLSLFTVKEAGAVPIFEHCGFKVIRESRAEYFESPDGQSLTESYMERDVDGLGG